MCRPGDVRAGGASALCSGFYPYGEGVETRLRRPQVVHEPREKVSLFQNAQTSCDRPLGSHGDEADGVSCGADVVDVDPLNESAVLSGDIVM